MDINFSWLHIYLAGILIIQLNATIEKQSKAKREEGEYFEVAEPFLFDRKARRSTTLHKGQHLDDITLRFQAFGKQHDIKLHLNKNLFSKNYIVKTFEKDRNIINKPRNHIRENCFYHGVAEGDPGSMAAFSTCSGISGFLSYSDGHAYHVVPGEEVLPGAIKVFHEATTGEGQGFRHCSHDDIMSELTKNSTLNSKLSTEYFHRHKRSLRKPYDSNTNSRFVELYIVNDHRTFVRHGQDEGIIIKRTQDIANIVSRLYRPLNVYIALVGIEIWNARDKIQISPHANQSLEYFLSYRKQRINPFHPNDNAQLITGQVFHEGVVGKAIKSSICTHQFSGGVDMDRQKIAHVATTVAHELGHNFGMDHDNYSFCKCQQDMCIMAPTSGGYASPTEWSSCSKVALLEAFEMGMDYCLHNLPESLSHGPTCGNSLVEDGEECDCGEPEDCTNKCCNATTCKLRESSQCATGTCCDLATCKYKPAATLCRPAFAECDLPEYCNGEKEYCPFDVYLQNGVSCNEGRSYCYKGKCTTHSDQCKLLWGPTGRVSDPICFQHLNTNNSKHGNCGYDWVSDRYTRCDKSDVMCGLLHCVHLNEKLMFWQETLAKATPATFLTKGREHYVCRSVILDVGLDMPDPGMTPDGAKCGYNKICINHTCTPTSLLDIKTCPDCHGNGVCNSLGQCHCYEQFGPPYCDGPGHGGSIHSGPMNITEDKSLLIGLLVFFALFILLCALLLLAFYHRKKLRKIMSQRTVALKYSVPGNPFKKRCPKAPSAPSKPSAPESAVSTSKLNPRSQGPPPYTRAMQRDGGNVCLEMISGPVLQESTNSQSETSPFVGKKIKPALFNKFQSEKENSPKASPKPLPKPPPKPPAVSEGGKQEGSGVVKKGSFHREISDPVLISTTDRRSKAFVKEFSVDNVNKEDTELGDPQSVTRRVSRERPPPRPTSLPPQAKKEERKRENRKSALSPPRPPNPPPVLKVHAGDQRTVDFKIPRREGPAVDASAPKLPDKTKVSKPVNSGPGIKLLPEIKSGISARNSPRAGVDSKKVSLAADTSVKGKFPREALRPSNARPLPASRESKPKTPKDTNVKGQGPAVQLKKPAAENATEPFVARDNSNKGTTNEPQGGVSSGVAAITALFDQMDVGSSLLSSDRDSSPETARQAAGKRSEGGNRPKPPPKSGSRSQMNVRSVDV